ncbi:NADH dehydrogenase [ubiquinone] 1 alpha subcomplex subunit 11 [Genypterus blacodes]|uniref:NADH dehydrogenase [ubiquinone] 1 alpha subcomplex subunit 11 n=1 Tax=Genypterus blacodes TaxID=154954 RepID=UPI003F76974A
MGYWDIQEGTDCVQKTWITTKFAAALGLVGSAYHLAAFQPESALAGVQRAGSATLGMATLGAVFGMTTCLSAHVREDDEPLNYFIGGCATGVFLGAKTHSVSTGASACLLLGTMGYFTKVGKMEGWRLAGPPKL